MAYTIERQFICLKRDGGLSALADRPPSSTRLHKWEAIRAHHKQAASPLVPLKQTPRVHLVRHVSELVAPAVGDDHIVAGLEGLQVVRGLGPEELRRVLRGLVDHHGNTLGLHALHDAPDGARGSFRSWTSSSGGTRPRPASLRFQRR